MGTRLIAFIVTVLVAGCGPAAPLSDPMASSGPPDGQSAPATVPTPAGRPTAEGVVRVRVTGVPRVEDGSVNVCPADGEQCAGVVVTGPHAKDVAAAAERDDVIVEITGRYDGATLAADGPPSVVTFGELERPFGTPCESVEGTPTRPSTGPWQGNPPDGTFEALDEWIATHRDRYAASWWDGETYTVNVLVTGSVTDELRDGVEQRVRDAIGGRPGGDVGVCLTGDASATEHELAIASGRLERVVADLGESYAVSGWSSAPRRGVIEVTASHMDMPTVDALSRAAGVPVDVWAFLTVLDGMVADLPPYRGGRHGSVPLDTSAARAGAGMNALGYFTLRYDRERGCVYLDDGQSRVATVWPFGYTADGDPLRIYDADGAEVLREGDRFSSGGGFVPAEVDHPCGARGDVWIMNGVPEREGSR